MIKIYNTFSGKKEEFTPIKAGHVGMYVCGPTVYDVPHVGHARSAFIFEVIRRYFEYAGFEVKFVRNVTDVDDKIINKALSELGDTGEGDVSSVRLKEKVNEVSERYLEVYHREIDVLGVRKPVVEPKATENIERMIEFIEKLIEKEYAYAVGQDVYFSVRKFSEYGKLSNQDTEQMMHGTRVGVDEKKQDPLDFALWKGAKPSEPFWESPWGRGRPGWHIECSVMSTDILGANFDIHGGGRDLIFPHHENEIAQAEALTGKKFANYWLHNGLLTINKEKMSKSLGNYVKISDFLDKHKDPDLLKMIFLNSHYRSPMDYNDKKIDEARSAKERIIIFKDKAEKAMSDLSARTGEAEELAVLDAVEKAQGVVDGLQEKFNEAMDDDFNTPSALSIIFDAVHTGNECLCNEDISFAEKAHTATAIKNFILRSAEVLCLSMNLARIEEDEIEKINRLILKREDARKKKDFAEADNVRDRLAKMGIVIEDTPKRTVWRKI